MALCAKSTGALAVGEECGEAETIFYEVVNLGFGIVGSMSWQDY